MARHHFLPCPVSVSFQKKKITQCHFSDRSPFSDTKHDFAAFFFFLNSEDAGGIKRGKERKGGGDNRGDGKEEQRVASAGLNPASVSTKGV